ncbi:hypothetical protein V6N11_010403 [Hibiscus sabdariffa]|uniref:Uncharacterized protein n=1 Tax=Hibiscus sabdariffa TaxID=183260 RepID=A0ABR2S617_9ROSI
MVDGNKNWKWSCFESVLPMDVLLRIAITIPPTTSAPSDEVVWRCTSTRIFTVKSAYTIHGTPREWLGFNLKKSDFALGYSVEWPMLFGTLLWLLWKNRNRCIFELLEPSNVSILASGRRLVQDATVAKSFHANHVFSSVQGARV